VFDETRSPSDEVPPVGRVSTELVVAGLAVWVALGAAVCLLSYRRQGARR
jgi:hypothetical protein